MVTDRLLPTLRDIAERYATDPTEALRYEASNFGRQCLDEGLGPQELVEMHQRVVDEIVGAAAPERRVALRRTLDALVLELMAVYQQSHGAIDHVVGQLKERYDELARTKADLQRTHDDLDNILASMLDSLAVTDVEGRIRKVNAATLRWLGYREEELLGKPLSILFSPESSQAVRPAALAAVYRQGGLAGYDATYRTRDGRDIPVSFSAAVLQDAQGNPAGLVGMARDVTELRALIVALERSQEELRERTAQLVQTGKMNALGELAAGVAHELNQPLNVIRIICAEVLRDMQNGRLDQTELAVGLREAEEEVKRMAEIIRHLSHFTQRAAVGTNKRLRAADPVDAVLKVIQGPLTSQGIELSAELDRSLCVTGHVGQLQELVMNLLTNARDAVVERAPAGGMKISVRVHGELRDTPHESLVVYEITDNGDGIPTDLQDRIFEPFFTTKEPGRGTGLGLSVARQVVREHGGSIAVRSRMGSGTTVRVFLPATPNNGPGSTKTAGQAASGGGGGRP